MWTRNSELRVALGGAAAIATIALMVSVAGCGKRGGTSQSANASQPVAQAQAGTLSDLHAGEPQVENTPQEGDTARAPAPDVEASLGSLVAKPGEEIQITAVGSPDVTGMFLTDDLKHAQPFSYDADAKLWSTTYRLPLKPMSDHLAFSVTARNQAGRWRRVWVFVNVTPEAEEPKEAKADSLPQPGQK
jgi:hypothetical protein